MGSAPLNRHRIPIGNIFSLVDKRTARWHPGLSNSKNNLSIQAEITGPVIPPQLLDVIIMGSAASKRVEPLHSGLYGDCPSVGAEDKFSTVDEHARKVQY